MRQRDDIQRTIANARAKTLIAMAESGLLSDREVMRDAADLLESTHLRDEERQRVEALRANASARLV